MAQRGGIGLSESLKDSFNRVRDQLLEAFSSQHGFSSSKHGDGETSSFGNTSQDVDSRQIAMKLKKVWWKLLLI